VKLAAQRLRPGAHILQFVESAPAARRRWRWGSRRHDRRPGRRPAVLAVVLMVGWLALSNIFGRYK
jgi:hypothetical protein